MGNSLYSKKEQDIKYAGFNMRMLANIIDSIITIIFLLPLITIFNNFYMDDKYGKTLESIGKGYTNMDLSKEVYALIAVTPSFIFQSVLMTAFVIIFWFYKNATPGKMLLSMKIVDANTFEEATKKQLFLRYIGYFFSLILLGIGFMMIYYDKRHQGLHDKIAKTVVIYYKKEKTKKSKQLN